MRAKFNFLAITYCLLTLDSFSVSAQTVEEIVLNYADGVLHASHREEPHTMTYRRDYAWPTGVYPKLYTEWMNLTNEVAPPNYRLTGQIGPVLPDGRKESTYSYVWNGRSEAVLYDYKYGSDNAVINRGEQTQNEESQINLYLNALGIPTTPRQKREKKYWLPGTVTSQLGYEVDAEAAVIEGDSCRVVRRGTEDVLWFKETPKGYSLVKRDVWITGTWIYRTIYQFKDFRPDGLPENVRMEFRRPVERIGASSEIDRVETLRLTGLDTSTPRPERFVLDIGPGVDIIDLNSMTVYRTQDPELPPFDSTLRKIPKVYPFNTALWVTLLVSGVFALLSAVRAWALVKP